MRTVDIAFAEREEVVCIVGSVVADIGLGYPFADGRFVQLVWLGDDTHIEEWIETDVEVLPEEVEIIETEPELDIGIGVSFGKNTVAQYAP